MNSMSRPVTVDCGKAGSQRRREYNKAWFAAHPGYTTNHTRKLNGYPAPTRPDLGICELCGGKNRTKGLHLDHCHKTGKFRGWLCSNCNTGIGKLGDNVAGLQKAIAYLEK